MDTYSRNNNESKLIEARAKETTAAANAGLAGDKGGWFKAKAGDITATQASRIAQALGRAKEAADRGDRYANQAALDDANAALRGIQGDNLRAKTETELERPEQRDADRRSRERIAAAGNTSREAVAAGNVAEKGLGREQAARIAKAKLMLQSEQAKISTKANATNDEYKRVMMGHTLLNDISSGKGDVETNLAGFEKLFGKSKTSEAKESITSGMMAAYNGSQPLPANPTDEQEQQRLAYLRKKYPKR